MANDRERRRARRNEAATPGFGHFLAEVPKSLHIGAYCWLRPSAVLLRNRCKQQHSLPAGLEDGPNCHAEGRKFESLQPLSRDCPARRRVGLGVAAL